MKTFTLFLFIASSVLFAQTAIPESVVGIHLQLNPQGKTMITTNPVQYNPANTLKNPSVSPSNIDSSGSMIRYSFIDPVAIGEYSSESGDGTMSVVGWYLNNERASAYGNSNNNPLWDFPENPLYPPVFNYVSSSSNGSKVINGYYTKLNLLNGTNGTPIWTLDLTTLPYSVYAGPVGITSTGNMIVASANGTGATDSSTIFGFNNSSNVPVWTIRVAPGAAGGSQIQGVKISGNDSLAIVNNYLNLFVVKVNTGQVMYSGTVNPLNNNGTQTSQGISANGNVIATINYYGYLRVLQWNGSTYNLVWENREPPGTYINWMSAVDVSNDGSLVAGGTLNFISSSTFDGKVKFWNIANGSTPVWVYAGTGDEVSAVAFSKNGKFLSASSWGNINNPSTLNLLVFKTTHATNQPWFAANDPGSFFWTAISDDGITVEGSGKHVHARQFGNGGMLYNLFIDTSENQTTGNHNNHKEVPASYSLSQNYPNPFNPSTLITYQLPKSGYVKLSMFNILGQEIKVLVSSNQQPGTYNIRVDASELPSGVYYYKLQSGDFSETKKMILIK